MSERDFHFGKQLKVYVPAGMAAAAVEAAHRSNKKLSAFIRDAIEEEMRRLRKRERSDAA